MFKAKDFFGRSYEFSLHTSIRHNPFKSLIFLLSVCFPLLRWNRIPIDLWIWISTFEGSIDVTINATELFDTFEDDYMYDDEGWVLPFRFSNAKFKLHFNVRQHGCFLSNIPGFESRLTHFFFPPVTIGFLPFLPDVLWILNKIPKFGSSRIESKCWILNETNDSCSNRGRHHSQLGQNFKGEIINICLADDG